MIVGVPKEVKQDEYRVAMVPAGVEELTRAGQTVLIQSGAGAGSGISDGQYSATGATILRNVGDPAAREPCGACGNCRPATSWAPQDRDVLHVVLSGIVHAGERYGRRRIIAMLIGDTADLPTSLARVHETGSLRTEGAERVGLWIDAALAGGLLRVSADQYRTLALTDAGCAVLAGTLPEPAVRVPDRRRGARRWHVDADWRLFASTGRWRRNRIRFGRRDSWYGESDNW